MSEAGSERTSSIPPSGSGRMSGSSGPASVPGGPPSVPGMVPPSVPLMSAVGITPPSGSTPPSSPQPTSTAATPMLVRSSISRRLSVVGSSASAPSFSGSSAITHLQASAA